MYYESNKRTLSSARRIATRKMNILLKSTDKRVKTLVPTTQAGKVKLHAGLVYKELTDKGVSPKVAGYLAAKGDPNKY